MTEADWLAATDPQPMLDFLRARGGASARKLRLFAVACCLRVWYLMTDERSQRAVEIAERFADGQAAAGELLAAYRAARDPADVYHEEAAAAAAHDDAGHAAAWAAEAAAFGPDEPAWRRDFAARRAAQAALLRCIFGNPFRPAPSLAPAILAWDGGIVPKLAQAIYEERAFHRLPVLADALEDAGCTDAAILGHCRCGGEHARGCWVVDLVLGRE